MRATDILRTKRDGGPLSCDQIEFFVRGVTDGSLPDYQASALLMAVVLRGMTGEETAWLTDAMVRSGIRVDLSAIPGSKVDKHSTGGVGDKTSLVLAPLAAACGVKVPMMSGRGLGHTGGTLDKLEAIPGFRVDLSIEELRAALETVGCAMLGQTRQIAPADKKLYALRDVTATVESIPLITASIMSKKIAEGIDGLVLDVKTGRGAFMKTLEDSRRLARSLVDTGNRSGVRTEALITAMDAPLGRAVGNALEVIECVETLKGRGPRDLADLSVLLAARMVRLAGLAASAEDAEGMVWRALASGAGVEKWREIVAHQGGDPRTVDDYGLLPSAPLRHTVRAARSGFLSGLDAERVGRASVALGAGRTRVDEDVDPGVGAIVFAHPGDEVREGDAILELHVRKASDLDAALALLEGAVEIADAPPARLPLVVEEVT
ncbi:MAG TPA: thymidine phosphorylase [Vicinamibacterales bacterium]|nr:thymidine phosphorylase [Vicinamibacterales bacterium]